MNERKCVYCVHGMKSSVYPPCRECYADDSRPHFIARGDCANNNATAEVDMVNHPPHYNNGGMETIDEMILIFGEEAVANYCICNAWKYRARALYKNQDEDMKKSHWYINKYKELMGV